MASSKQRPKLVVIVGPTASGKSGLAIEIAREFNGEIITADSRTVYKGMDIGTAKSSAQDQNAVKHWGLNLVEPGEPYSANDFKLYAKSKIADIQKRDKLPILVGGTGLYVDGVLYDFRFRPKTSSSSRQQLESLSIEELQKIITNSGYKMPENNKNKRYLIRTIEAGGIAGKRAIKPVYDCLIVGLNPNAEILESRINSRAEQMFKAGVIEETRSLVDKYGREVINKTAGLIYGLCMQVIDGEISKAGAIELSMVKDRQYAKRQLTWFKRNQDIHWNSDKDSAKILIEKYLNT